MHALASPICPVESSFQRIGDVESAIDGLKRVVAIKAATDDVFANCKLAPEADAARYDKLVPLIGGIQAFVANPADTSDVAAMRHAVADYPCVFDYLSRPIKAGPDSEDVR